MTKSSARLTPARRRNVPWSIPDGDFFSSLLAVFESRLGPPPPTTPPNRSLDARSGSVTLAALIYGSVKLITKTETGRLLDRVPREFLSDFCERRYVEPFGWRRRHGMRPPQIRVDISDPPPAPRDLEVEGTTYRIATEIRIDVTTQPTSPLLSDSTPREPLVEPEPTTERPTKKKTKRKRPKSH